MSDINKNKTIKNIEKKSDVIISKTNIHTKNTEELENILKQAKEKDWDDVLCNNSEICITDTYTEFYNYIKDKIKEKGFSESDVFFRAGIDLKYGYRMLNGERKIQQSDILIRFCYAAEFSLEETQKALKLYGFRTLYPKVKREALIMLLFNDRPGNIDEFNEKLIIKGEKPLKTNGIKE